MSSGVNINNNNQPYPLASTSSPSTSTISTNSSSASASASASAFASASTSTSTSASTSLWPISPPTSSESKRHELDKFLMEQKAHQQQHHLPSPPNSARSTSSLKQYDSNNEWKTSGTIPSLMGKCVYFINVK
jgi:hypothetical protein